MNRGDLLEVCNYILTEMRGNDSVQMRAIDFYKGKGSDLQSEQYIIIMNYLLKEERFIKLIDNKIKFPTARYRLTEKGKNVVSLGSIEAYHRMLNVNRFSRFIKDYFFQGLTVIISIIALVHSCDGDKEINILEKRINNIEDKFKK